MPRTVLVVDDSPIIRRVLIRCLRLAGMTDDRLLEAGDGDEALAHLDAAAVDLVLCDLHMPGIDGNELLHRLADDGRLARLPVVVISSDRSLERRAELRSLGVRDFLGKPFTPESVGACLAGILEEAP